MTLQDSGEQASDHPPTTFAYDVFVVHAPAAPDEAFVQGYLLAKLALPPERVLRLQTLELGRLITEEIERGVRSSRVTLVVLSSACMDDHWVVFAQQLSAFASMAKRTHGLLLPLLLEDCRLNAHVQSLTKLDFRNTSHEVWEAQIDRLRAHFDRPVAPVTDLPCPYPGMRPFTAGDADRFFGRDAEIDNILRWLRRGKRAIYLIGASGSGKSSLIAAGLLPRLIRGIEGIPSFHAKTIRPGEQPMERLAAALDGDVSAPVDVIGLLLARHAPATSLLLVIDQLEELFAIASAEQRSDFLTAVGSLRRDPRCVLLFALRADFYGSFMDSPLWTDHDGRISHINLGPLRRDSLRVVIERPARELEVYLQPELVSCLLDDAAREPGALPLLQETLFQLWAKRRQRLLALADYRALSDGARTGLAFAVKEHADDVYRVLSPAQKVIAFRIFLRLVNFGEGRADTRRQQPRDALRSESEVTSDFDAVLWCLVNNRLVTVTGDDQDRDARVDLAHEILIHAWTTLADWIQTWRANEQRRREIEAAAAAWRARGGGDGGLLDPVELASARAWQDKAAQQLGQTTDLAAFLVASERAHTRAIQQRRRTSLALVTVPCALILAFIALRCASRALEQRDQRNQLIAESAQLYQDVGWQRLIESERPLQALPYLVAAGEARETSGAALSQSLRMLFAAATRNLPLSPPDLHQGRVLSAAFSPDGARVVADTWDDTARIWNTATGKSFSLPVQYQMTMESTAFSSDGTRVLVSNWDNTACVRDAVTGKSLSPPLLHHGAVLSAAFSPDGARVVTSSWDNTARVWDVATGKPLSPSLQHHGAVLNAAFSRDGARVVTASDDKTARIWDATTGRLLATLSTHSGRVIKAVFSSDGTRVVTASDDKTARIWDAVTGKPLSPPLQHLGAVRSAEFSADSMRVVTASDDKTARIWDAATGKPLSLPLEHQDPVRSAAFSSDGTRVVTTSGDKTTRVWHATAGPPLAPSLDHPDIVWSAAFSLDGTRVVTVSTDKTARVWDAATGKPLSPRLRHQGRVLSAAFSPDGARIITTSEDGTACLWDVVTGRPLSQQLQHQGAVMTATFSPDGARIFTVSAYNTANVADAVMDKPSALALRRREFVAGGDDTRVAIVTTRIWDGVTGEPLSPPLQHQDEVLHAAFNSDGTRLVTTSGSTARVWDTSTGEPLSPLLQHQDTVVSATFSSDGIRVITASLDKTARVWDAVTGEPVSPPLEHQRSVVSAAFSPDGLRVVTASLDRTARVWDAVTGKPVSPPLQHQGTVRSATFSSDGTRVVTASEDKTARVWDAATGKPLSPPLQHRDTVRSAAFSSDGTRVVTASEDKTARIWNLPLASGTVAEWRTMVDSASPYVLTNGVLLPRAASDSQGAPRRH